MEPLKSIISELVVMGFSGQNINPGTEKTLREWCNTQIILFSHNYDHPEQLIKLTDQIQSIRSDQTLPTLISADQEGGLVQRFKKGFTLLPSAKKIGDHDSAQHTYELARIQAQELFAAGIQLNYCPVADINTNPKNPVIGSRAYGDDAEIVAKHASAVVRGHRVEGIDTCAKHFPGHGDTSVDSHYDLPTVTTPLSTLQNREWIPFTKSIRSGSRFVMSAHIMLPHIDEQYPGTLSKTVIQNFLRSELRYEGVIISDDMEMHAITKNFGQEEAPLLALEAGCDLLCYRSEDQSLIALHAIEKAVVDGRIKRSRIEESVQRIREIKNTTKLAAASLNLKQRLQLIGSEDHLKFVAEHFS